MSLRALKSIFFGLLSLVILLSLYLGAWAAIDVRRYIDLQRVQVFNAVSGDPRMHVDRIIERNFRGGYRVQVRNTLGRGVVCSTGNVAIDYDAEAELPGDFRLTYWAWGGSCTERLRAGLPPGQYFVRTCHFVRFSFFPIKERCVSSNPFRIGPRKQST